jgi:hypothetical protein
LRGSHNEQSVGLSVCWRHVGVVLLPLNSQAIVTLVMCCWMYPLHALLDLLSQLLFGEEWAVCINQ